MASLLAALAAGLASATCNCPSGGCTVTSECAHVVKVKEGPPPPVVGSDMMSRRIGNPSSSLTLTFLHNNVPSWADLPGAELRSPPPEVEGIPTFVPSAVLTSGSEVVFHCPASTFDVCDAWVFFYSCQQSCIGKYQAGVTTVLANDGWDHTNCAPRFVTGVPSGYSHQMRSYRTKVQPGQSVSFETTSDAEFLAFGLDTDGIDCEKLTNRGDCVAVPRGACLWSPLGQCLPTRCRRGGQGPPPPCRECPWADLANRSPQDGPF